MKSTSLLPHSLRRAACVLMLLLPSGLLASSCLTPDATFSDDPEETIDGLGGNGGADSSVSPSCDNRRQDGDETDTDCGGLDCAPCGIGSDCEKDSDCLDSICVNEECQAETCTDDEKSGSETDVDCGGPACGPCAPGESCLVRDDCDSQVCVSGECAEPACDDRVQNGNESDIDCGGNCSPCPPGLGCVIKADCEQPPFDNAATTNCEEEVCTLVCPSGSADCNESASDGCETNLNTDASHCGACGEVCMPEHTVAGKCAGGECLIDFEAGGCTGAWLDCNGAPEDGCETNSNNDEEHCGECNEACSDANGSPSCVAGLCEIACSGTFADCDDDARSNGCEVDTDTSTEHCGTCDNGCTPSAGEVAACDTSQVPACVSISCDQPGDCGGQSPCGACGSDQVCNDLLNTTNNCGGCGIQCGASNATVACVNAGGWQCAVQGCVDSGGANYENCDGQYENGCETNVNSNLTKCGGCVPGSGTNCQSLLNNASLHISSITCDMGSCKINGCDGTWADCDGSANNGCEVNTATNGDRCGGCLSSDPKPGSGVDCDTQPNATGECSGSACVINVCNLPQLTGTGCAPKAVTQLVDGSTSIAGQFSASWSGTNLVVVIDITDSTGFNDSPEHWQDDGAEIYIDLNNEKTQDFDSNDYQLLVAWNDSAVQGVGNGLNTGLIGVAQSSISGGYRLTVTIPWSALGGASAPAQGAIIGFDVALNDDSDGGGRNGQRMWVGNNQNFMDPFRWGNLKLN